MRSPQLLLVLVAACRGSDSSKSASPAPAKPTEVGGCPLPASPDVTARFAVGIEPDYRVNSAAGEAAKCHDEFVANAVVTIDAGHPKLVAEGTFEGRCAGATSSRRFEAVAPAKAVIEIIACLHDGELGVGKPALLELAQPDKLIALKVRPADRCGTPLDLGITRNLAKWSLGDGCKAVVKLVPFTGALAVAEETQLAPLGVGTCTATVELLGAKTDVAVTVK